ncbi:hypothetical protein [Marinoscillum sp.]|uniref:hypothetical protein n=1 Tax=Marinoscillum sp. TaxID=2024838 RepID=UPI003BA88297
MESGRTDYVAVTAEDQDEFPEYIDFKTPTGTIPSQSGQDKNTRELTLSGLMAGNPTTLTAFATQEDAEGNATEVTLGRLDAVAYDMERQKVVIVPVNDAQTPDANVLYESLNKIYAQAVAQWEVVVDHSYSVEPEVLQTLDEGESGLFASFPKNMKQFQKDFSKSRDTDKDAYYLFLIPGSGARAGFMPFKRQYGYIWTGSTGDLPRTIAHELAHGAFRLRHTFSPEAFIATQGSTDNLMDYSSGATHLYKHQWDNVHNPEGVTSWLQVDEEGAMEGEQNPVESFVSEKLTTLNLNAEQQVAGYLYCRKCDEEVRDFQEVSISSSLTEVIYQRLKCLLYTFNVTGDGFNSEEEGDIDLTDQSQLSLGEIRILSLMETSESTQALFGVLKSNELLPCSKFIDDYFDSFDYCDQSLGANEKDLLLNSLTQCIGSQATGKKPNELVENIKRTLQNSLSPNERITVFVTTEGAQEVLGHSNESESLFTVTIDQQGTLDLSISEQFLRDLGFTDPSIIAEIIQNLDDLVDEAKIKFCGDSKVNPQCVSEVFEFLQLMSLNLEHIAKAGVMHSAMWKSDDPVRHLIPEKGKWSPLVGGAIDGGVESAMGIPILVSTLGQLIIFEDQRNAALQIFTAAGFDRLKEAVASEIVEVFTNDERREYAITKASVELALSYYVLLGKAAKGLGEVLEKVGTLGNKLEKCPSLRKYVQQSVEGKDVVRLKKFDDLATEVGSEKLEAIFSRVDVEKLDDLLDDLSESVNFKTALANEPELVEAWSSFKKAGLDDLARNTDNLDALNKALKQDGYDAAYFENLLKSKQDPQKFIDDYVSKIGDNGKFVDDVLESDYTSYLARKSNEGKAARDRADWNHARDYWLNDSPMARGNAFNETARIERWYPFNEVTLSNGKRLDGYKPPKDGKPGEIVSRKATDLGDIQLSTFESYLSEMKIKYAPGTSINAPKYGDLLKGKKLEGDMFLELPDSNLNLPYIQDYIDLANSKGITLRFKPE